MSLVTAIVLEFVRIHQALPVDRNATMDRLYELDPAEYPWIGAALVEGSVDDDTQYRFSLACTLAGLALLIDI